MQHVVFHRGSSHSEGAGAKWREVKYGIWLALRLSWLLQSNENASVAWLPNPAMMQNPHIDIHRSMMGGMGMIGAAPLALQHSPSWLRDQISSGAFDQVQLRPDLKRRSVRGGGYVHTVATDRAIEAQALRAIGSATKPVAFILQDTWAPMHWHGSAGRWLHDAFISHRLERAKRVTGKAELAAPEGVEPGRYLVSVHIRDFKGSNGWNLPGVRRPASNHRGE